MPNIEVMASNDELNEPGQVLYNVYKQLKELAVLVHGDKFTKEEIIIALAAISDDIKAEIEEG